MENTKLDKSSISRSTAITQEGANCIDAVELNESINDTLANKVNKLSKIALGSLPIYTDWLVCKNDAEFDQVMENLPLGTVIMSPFGVNYGGNKICSPIGLTGGCTGLLVGFRTAVYGMFIFYSYGTGVHIMKCDFSKAVYSNWYPIAE